MGAPRNDSFKRGGVEKSAKSHSSSPPRSRTVTRSSSRGASPAVSAGKSRRSGTDNVKSAVTHLTQNIPIVSGHRVFRVVPAWIRRFVPGFSLIRPIGARDKAMNAAQAEGCSNVGGLRPSERISSSRAKSIEPRVQSVTERGRRVARSVASSGFATLPTPGKRNQPAKPQSSDEVLEQARNELLQKFGDVRQRRIASPGRPQ